MEAELQSHVAFHLTGKRPASDLDAVDELALVPVLLAPYRDLASLRYDYPVVLAQGSGPYVEALSAAIDRVLREVAQGDDGERISRHAFRMEATLRRLVASGARGTLSALWEKAAAALPTTSDDLLADSLAKVRAALRLDGEIVDCDTTLAPQLFAAAAQRVYERKARRFDDEVRRLIQKLSEILRADFVRSAPGRTPESLRASFGTLHDDVFDFGAMSRLLSEATPDQAMPTSRRRRINALLDVLQSQRFYPATASGSTTYAFQFSSCQEALAAYRERSPEVVGLARAIGIAELEIAGEYREARHDAFFDGYSEADIDPADLALFPDYIITVSSAGLHATENATLMEMLAAGLPVKVLVQTEDILDEPHTGEGHLGFGARARQLAHMAIGLNEVYVLQSSASNLYQYRDRIYRGMEQRGAALFTCYCPTGVTTPGVPAYVVAAAAMESRAFPAFTFDPAAGSDWASRFDLSANPQVDLDWPVQRFDYEDANHQRHSEDLAFTVVDFVACDVRFTRHFARVPTARWSTAMVSAGAALGAPGARAPGVVPCAWMLDRQNQLQKVLVDDKLMREAQRCRDLWHSLQELGGVHNSHAERLLMRERQQRSAEAQSAPAPTPSDSNATASVAAAGAPAEAPAAAEAQPAGDDPYIETARCTTCNECTNLNDKMFGYNENKQATIINPDAGTYAQLVEAAENCQVSIIHPGKPRNPKEPGLDALLERAKPFL